jgi:flavin reductase (DIM6/NTAB) family NADH-FMN oxidoreductase RutF
MDPERKKRALRTLTYGMYVAGAAEGEELAAGAINWISQASFVPPLIMLALRSDSNLHRLAERSQRLAVNVLTREQKGMAAAFFKPSRVEADRIQGFAFQRGSFSGAPILADAWAWLEARVTDTLKRGDHTVFVAEVVEADIREGDFQPLVMWETGWTYGG